MAVNWNIPRKKYILWTNDIKSMFFFFNYHISFQDMQSFFEFLVSVINNYHFNELHEFRDSFKWFCCDAKYFASFVQGIVIED